MDDCDWLRSQGYDSQFVDYLRTLRFSGDVQAIPEGTAIGAATPILRVEAPRIEATLLETAILALVNHETLIATKAARIVDTAAGKPVWDFSARRLHGHGAAIGVARAAYIGGCEGTATVIAGKELGIPTTGTMAHHYLMSRGEHGEQEAFETFLRDFPDRPFLLVDTFDTQRGVARAMAASSTTGIPLGGIRIDSGDIAAEAQQARRQFDAAGLATARIFASGDLDEYAIAEFNRRGAPIDAYGIGTKLGTSYDAPALGGVYKLVAQRDASGEWEPVMKFSQNKVTDPGRHQIFRAEGLGDTLGLVDERLSGRPLLRPYVEAGNQVFGEPLDTRRDRCRQELASLPTRVRAIESPQQWSVRRSPALDRLRTRLTAPTRPATRVANVVQ